MAKQNYTSTATPLPHFNNNKVNNKVILDPLRKNLFEMIFNFKDISKEENELLSGQLISIKKDKIKFNINLDDKGDIIPLNIINKIIGKRSDVEINLHYKNGTIHNRIYINGFQIAYICKHFFDFSYVKEDLIAMKVKFVYDSYKIVRKNDINMFTLNKKIKKIKCTSSDSQ